MEIQLEFQNKVNMSRYTQKSMKNSRHVKAQAADACMISLDDIEDVYCVTPTQEGLWTASTQKYDAYAYELVIEGKSNIENNFQAAWQELVRTTPMLRSFMLTLGPTNQLFQVVLHAGSSYAGQICSINDNTTRATHANPLESKGLARLYFSTATSVGRDTFQARLRIHHALFDGWAMCLALERLRKAYVGESLASLPEFQQFIEYVHDQNTASDKNGASSFWRSRMAGCSRTDIVDRVPGLKNAVTDTTATFVSQQTVPSNAGSFTLSAIAHAAWSMLAGAYAATDDVLFATALSGRDVPVEDVLDMVGPTMAVVPYRAHIKTEQSVAKFLEEVTCNLQLSATHQHVGLARICTEYGGFQTSHLQTLLVCQPSYLDVVGLQSQKDVVDPDWRVTEHVDYIHPYALVIECWLPRGVGSMRLTAHHDSRLISSSRARMLLEQLSGIIFQLNACVTEPFKFQTRVGDICLASSGDLEALRKLNADKPMPVDRCIHDLFTESLEGHATSIAVDAWDGKFTYKRINELSDALSQRLRHLGVGPEVCSFLLPCR